MASKTPTKSYRGRERRIKKPSPALIGLSVLGMAGIAYATLCPIGMRPHLASADQERFGAYFVLGVVLALAAPRRWASVTLFVIVLAIGLEAAQLIIPGRDGRVHDALVKAAGGAIGAQLGFLSFAARRRLSRFMMMAQSNTKAVKRHR